jgi:RNA polymerase sigma factor (sigma-70 family)
LRAAPRRAADEEDVALSAFDSFCRAAETGRFPRLEDRDDLWQVLVLLASRKAANLAGHEQRQKRGGGKVIQSLDAPAGSASSDAAWFGALIGKEPDPAVAAEVAEECQGLLDRLADDEMRAIAVRKLEGYTNDEIAAQLGCSPGTVERRLRLIRKCLQPEEKT